MYQQALLSWGNLQYEESQMVRVKQHTCSDAWHMGVCCRPYSVAWWWDVSHLPTDHTSDLVPSILSSSPVLSD